MKLSQLMLAATALVVAPLAMAASTPPDSGLLITRTNSQQWEIRLISGSQAEQFSGVVESDLQISAVTPLKLESTDSAKLLTPTSLGATLATGPGGIDGVNFSVSADAKLCIRDTGSSGVHIYLGDSLADAIPVTAPVALTSVDACGGVAAAATASTRKFHAGHYIVLGRGADTQSIMADALRPGVVGLVKRYTWRSLETAQGVYNFAEVKSDLAWCAAHGMHMIMIIEDKTFTLEKPGPAYLDKYDVRNRAGGYTVVRWNSTVVQRFNALTKALGTAFDSNANFEGIATQETALGLDSPALKTFGYTPEKYRDALISMLGTAATNLPKSRVFWLMNFLVGNQSYIGNIASAVASKGVVMGGPDVWPDNKSLQSKVYPFYTQFSGKMPLFGQVENVCYSEPHMTSGFKTKYWTMTELFNYARTKMHVNYMFWVRVTKASPADAYDWTDALPVISANRTWTPAP
jgi:hypothetical protein